MRNNFVSVLNQGVKIPIIQRDYAQGRTDPKTTKIRDVFLHALFGKIIENQSNPSSLGLELDFIYGYFLREDEHSAFIPLDGQQRLTTLWLLYWFIGSKEGVSQEEKSFLGKFLYETRHSTSLFCEKILNYNPTFSYQSISAEIKDQGWYFDSWNNDPGIRAMLVTIDSIAQLYEETSLNSAWNSITGSRCPFFFYQLDMGEVGLTDDLYIKMNSRGKSLTEFEYFKAHFVAIVNHESQKQRFEKSVDQAWLEAIWYHVMASGGLLSERDIALKVDSCFLNLFNYLTSVIAYERGIEYQNTANSVDSLGAIFGERDNQERVFGSFDAIVSLIREQRGFWANTFFYSEGNSGQGVRLFFQHKEPDILLRCLVHGKLSMPEQLILHACICHFRFQVEDFLHKIRVVRNLVINSDSELRESILGKCFEEIEHFMRTGDLSRVTQFKTDQIEEEREKLRFRVESPEVIGIMGQLEDSDLLRGSISILPFDHMFAERSRAFLQYFGEEEVISNFKNLANTLLSFGDYGQNVRHLYNLLAGNRLIFRRFFTSPGYNKDDFRNRTRQVVMDCLDFFIANPSKSIFDRLEEQLRDFEGNPKDWRYYFIRYPEEFRQDCEEGFYFWEDDHHYPSNKRRKKQANGFHWDPFLLALKQINCSASFELDDYGGNLRMQVGGVAIHVSTTSKGFLIERGVSIDGDQECVLAFDQNSQIVVEVRQNDEGIDLEDRIEVFRRRICQAIDENPHQ